jgi:NDP-sugar pyrophosphorylase family protein
MKHRPRIRGIKDNPSFSLRNQKFNVIILAAGLGTRLKPETDYIPKALIQIGQSRAIDYFIRKYQHIADKFIIATGYGADLLENYLTGKYYTLDIVFSREDVSELRGPGRSLVFALDHASSKLPTFVTFCDYIVDEYIPVDEDIVGVCRPGKEVSVLGEYTGLVVAEEGIVVDLIRNENPSRVKDMGFTGIAAFQNTLLLKMITYRAAANEGGDQNVDYTFDIVREFIHKAKTRAYPITKILEFGTEDTLRKTRRILGGSNSIHPE